MANEKLHFEAFTPIDPRTSGTSRTLSEHYM